MQRSYRHVARSWRPPHLRTAHPVGGNPRLADVVLYINTHLGDPDLGVDHLQSAFCVSRSTLYRMFDGLGGIARFIRKQRLAAARQYLHRNPGLGITQVLYEHGFGSERQFQRAFQAEFGVTPSEWREHCKASRDALQDEANQ